MNARGARPEPRKSSLAGSTPSRPDETTPAPPVLLRTASAAEPSERPRKKFPHKVSFYEDVEDTARVRAALLHTQVAEGSRSMSEFIHRAVLAEVVRLEGLYNHGEPWPGVGARVLPQGRPLGE